MTTGDTTTKGDVPRDFDLTCWYLNQRRVIELVGAETVIPGLGLIGAIGAGDNNLRSLAGQPLLKEALVNWMRSASPPTLGKLLISDTLFPGSLFTHYTNFFCRGLPKVSDALRKGKTPLPLAEAYAKLDDLRPGWRVSC